MVREGIQKRYEGKFAATAERTRINDLPATADENLRNLRPENTGHISFCVPRSRRTSCVVQHNRTYF